MVTMHFFGPGTAPFTRSRLFSASTRTTLQILDRDLHVTHLTGHLLSLEYACWESDADTVGTLHDDGTWSREP